MPDPQADAMHNFLKWLEVFGFQLVRDDEFVVIGPVPSTDQNPSPHAWMDRRDAQWASDYQRVVWVMKSLVRHDLSRYARAWLRALRPFRPRITSEVFRQWVIAATGLDPFFVSIRPFGLRARGLPTIYAVYTEVSTGGLWLSESNIVTIPIEAAGLRCRGRAIPSAVYEPIAFSGGVLVSGSGANQAAFNPAITSNGVLVAGVRTDWAIFHEPSAPAGVLVTGLGADQATFSPLIPPYGVFAAGPKPEQAIFNPNLQPAGVMMNGTSADQAMFNPSVQPAGAIVGSTDAIVEYTPFFG